MCKGSATPARALHPGRKRDAQPGKAWQSFADVGTLETPRFCRLVGKGAQAGQNRLNPLCLCTSTGDSRANSKYTSPDGGWGPYRRHGKMLLNPHGCRQSPDHSSSEFCNSSGLLTKLFCSKALGLPLPGHYHLGFELALPPSYFTCSSRVAKSCTTSKASEPEEL